MKMNQTILEPKLLGFWIRCIRKAQHMSALATSPISLGGRSKLRAVK
jgi:hypothetical protein